MSEDIQQICVYCRQPLPDEKNVIHTSLGKTCSRLCSHALCNEYKLEEQIIELKTKVNNIAQYLTNKVRKETGCNQIKIDFDNEWSEEGTDDKIPKNI